MSRSISGVGCGVGDGGSMACPTFSHESLRQAVGGVEAVELGGLIVRDDGGQGFRGLG
jgi:hypothetical protein